METSRNLWTRSFVVLTLANFLNAITFYVVFVSIAEYALETYGISYGLAGAVVSAFVVSALATRLLLGGAIDSWGIKRSITVGLGLTLLSTCLYCVEGSVAVLFLARVLHGFSFGIASGALSAGAALVVPPGRTGEGIGYFSMAQALATGVGPFVALYLMSTEAGFSSMFYFAVTASAVSFLASLFVELPVVEHAERAVCKNESVLRRFIQVDALRLSFVMLIVTFCYSGVVSFISVFAGERDLTQAVKYYFVVYSAVVLLTRPPVGRYVDRKGEKAVLYCTLLALCTGLVVLANSFSPVALLISAALIALGVGATQSTIQATIVKSSAQSELGKASSTFFMCMDLGSAIGSAAVGALIPLLGYTSCYFGLAGLALLACGLYHVAHGRKK